MVDAKSGRTKADSTNTENRETDWLRDARNVPIQLRTSAEVGGLRNVRSACKLTLSLDKKGDSGMIGKTWPCGGYRLDVGGGIRGLLCPPR